LILDFVNWNKTLAPPNENRPYLITAGSFFCWVKLDRSVLFNYFFHYRVRYRGELPLPAAVDRSIWKRAAVRRSPALCLTRRHQHCVKQTRTLSKQHHSSVKFLLACGRVRFKVASNDCAVCINVFRRGLMQPYRRRASRQKTNKEHCCCERPSCRMAARE